MCNNRLLGAGGGRTAPRDESTETSHGTIWTIGSGHVRHVLCSFSKHMKTIVEKDKHKHGESELRGLCVAANSLGSFRGLVIASFYEPR